MTRLSKNSVALAGEFAALSQSAVRGYDASMTLGNTKDIDILVFNPRTKRAFQIEVKTNYEKRRGPSHSRLFGTFETAWQMDEKHENTSDPNLFYCFVNINNVPKSSPQKTEFRFFIVPSAIVANYVRKQHQFWLNNDPAHRDTPRRQFRIGSPDAPRVAVPAPPALEYENNWDLITSPQAPITPVRT
jgi:hypothetical protein